MALHKMNDGCVERVMNEIIYADQIKREAVYTGYSGLDKRLGGMLPGEIYLVGALIATGKSCFTYNLLRRMCIENRTPAMLFTPEASAEYVIRRMIDAVCNCPSEIENSYAEQEYYKQAANVIKNSPFLIDDTCKLTIDDFIKRCREAKKDHPIRIVFLDSWEYIHFSSNPDKEEIIEAFKKIKSLAHELELTIVINMKLSWEITEKYRKYHTPYAYDFMIPAEALDETAGLMALHRESYFKCIKINDREVFEKTFKDQFEICVRRSRVSNDLVTSLVYSHHHRRLDDDWHYDNMNSFAWSLDDLDDEECEEEELQSDDEPETDDDSLSDDEFETAEMLEVRKVERIDAEQHKRVELHAHTKMSAMDGLNDVKHMVQMAEKWGHPAVAITDHGVVQAFPDAFNAAKNIKIIYGCEGYLLEDRDLIREDGSIDYKARPTTHVTLLAKNQKGLQNLYELVSLSHLNYFYEEPRLPKSVVEAHREGLIIGSACAMGEIYQAILRDAPEEELARLVSFYDYLEIQPLINNRFLIDGKTIKGNAYLYEPNRRILALGEKYGKPVVATGDAHYFDAKDALCRRILMARQSFNDEEGDEGLYFRTTDEMLEEFAYLGEEKAYEVVVKNTNMIADMIEPMRPVPEGRFLPKIDGAEEDLRTVCTERAIAMYGDPLPKEIRQRLDKEMNSIIDNGHAVIYRTAEMLVKKSLSDGYLVGSRGAMGSSFAAAMLSITEVNPLPPHYLCPNCKHMEWGDLQEYDCGLDMPDKTCPECGAPYRKEGFNIPFETFLGFNGDKEPGIDLNFADEYQKMAHEYVKEIFGPENVFKAGAIGTIRDRAAFAYVVMYFYEHGINVKPSMLDRLADCCVGVKRTSGQHPGGVIIVPRGHKITEFSPVQHPEDDVDSDIITTHFNCYAIDRNLLKLDILPHDVPSMLRQLQDMTGVDPMDVPLNDERVMSIFTGIEGLNIHDPEYRFSNGSLGLPGFDTRFVRQMLDEIQPTTFEELIRISGMSHNADVWLDNARDIVTSGMAAVKEVISTRDDIMNYLRKKGISNVDAFTIMEKVYKGRGPTEEQELLMREHGVPDWYIDSCRKIVYLFPRAHDVAYCMMTMRIAWFKVYYPVEYYAAWFTAHAADFDEKVMLRGQRAIEEWMDEIIRKGKNTSDTEEDEMPVLELAYEMYARGYKFIPARPGISDDMKFKAYEGKVLLPVTLFYEDFDEYE